MTKKEPQSRVEKYWQDRCAESQQAFAAIEVHLAARAAMLQRYSEIDRQAVETAGKLAAYNLANSDSPAAQSLRVELAQLRLSRDGLKAEWTRQHDRLSLKLEGLNRAFLTELHGAIMRRVEELYKQRAVQLIDRRADREGRARLAVEHNWGLVTAAQQQQLAFWREAQRRRLRPLSEIRELADRALESYQEADLDLREQATVTSGQLKEMQSGAAVPSGEVRGRLQAFPV